MLEQLLIPDDAVLTLSHVNLNRDHITVTLRTTATEAICPSCQGKSDRVHSRYQRTVADLPLLHIPITLQLHARRFFCPSAHCPRLTFSEPVPSLLAPRARRTLRLGAEQRRLGLDLGGEPGARLACRQGMRVSPDTLLRLARSEPPQSRLPPRLLGVDDFALRKGHVYGTILVDLERHQVVDLLPDRSAASLSHWLMDHPGVEVISRDRSGEYAEGASRGAPEAVQVADRFHLVQNLRDVLQAVLERHQAVLQTAQVPAAPAVPTPEPAAAGAPEGTQEPVPEPPVSAAKPTLTRYQQLGTQRRERRQVRYERVRDLQAQGQGIREIARRMGLSRQTVRTFLRADVFPERADRRCGVSKLDPFVAYLRARLEAGETNGSALWRELRDHHAFTGSQPLVRKWVARHRHLIPSTLVKSAPRQARPAATPPAAPAPPRRRSARQFAWLLIRPVAELEAEEQALVERVLVASPAVQMAYTLGLAFLRMVRQRDVEGFDVWLQQAHNSAIPEVQRFAVGLERDGAAVRAALTLPHSNGQVEGQVNRLKLIKRLAYGRAKFDLLRQRVLST